MKITIMILVLFLVACQPSYDPSTMSRGNRVPDMLKKYPVHTEGDTAIYERPVRTIFDFPHYFMAVNDTIIAETKVIAVCREWIKYKE